LFQLKMFVVAIWRVTKECVKIKNELEIAAISRNLSCLYFYFQ
jgi:hypothetical protein